MIDGRKIVSLIGKVELGEDRRSAIGKRLDFNPPVRHIQVLPRRVEEIQADGLGGLGGLGIG